MFKTATVFKLADFATRNLLDQIDAHIPAPTIVDPDKTQWGRAGFSHPEQHGYAPVFTGADNTRLFNVQIRERVLPGKVIKTKLVERCAEVAARQGRKCSRKEMMELKEEVIAALLPTAFIKPVDILCMITKDFLFIGTGSARLVDVALIALRGAYPDDTLNLKSIAEKRSVGPWMMDLLLNDTTDSGKFNAGEAVVLKGKNKSTARFKDVAMASEAVQDSVACDMSPVEIAVEFGERVHLALTDQLVLKRIKFSDVILKEAEADAQDAATHFEATVALVAGELRELVEALHAEIKSTDEDDEL